MSVLDFIFPRKCFGCGKEGKYICVSCLAKIEAPKPVCPICEKASIDGMVHIKCKKPLGLDGLVSLWDYDGVIRKAILALKYKYATDIVKLLNGYIVEELKRREIDKLLPFTPCLLPIPLHWYRENLRGFNQSGEIGKSVAEDLGWRFEPDLLIRKKLTPPQTELKAKTRTENIQGVFALNPNYSLVPSAYSLVLFDDVWTTGSTLKEACKVLKKGGVKNVWGMTIAR